MRASNLSIFCDALSRLKHELKNLRAEYKIEEFGLDDKKTIGELYDEWLVTKALRGRPSPLSFLRKKYERELWVLTKKKSDENTIQDYVTEYGLTRHQAYELLKILESKQRSYDDEYQKFFNDYIKKHSKIDDPKAKSK